MLLIPKMYSIDQCFPNATHQPGNPFFCHFTRGGEGEGSDAVVRNATLPGMKGAVSYLLVEVLVSGCVWMCMGASSAGCPKPRNL